MFFKVIGRIIVRFFQKLGRTTIGTGRFFGRHVIGTVVVVALVGGIAALLFTTSVFGLASPENSLIRTAANVPDSAKEQSVKVLKGLAQYNAGLMWQGFGEDYRQVLIKNGVDQPKLQQLLDSVKKQNQDKGRPITYNYFTYQGHGQLNDGITIIDAVEGSVNVGGKDIKTKIFLKMDNVNDINDIYTDDPVLSNTVFAAIVRPADTMSLVRPSWEATKVLGSLARGNTKELWSSISEDYRQQFADRGLDEAGLQSALDKSMKAQEQGGSKVVYDHFTVKNPASDAASQQYDGFRKGQSPYTEQYTAFVKLGDKATTYNYAVAMDVNHVITEVITDDPLMKGIFQDSLVTTADPTIKPRAAAAQVLQGISRFEAKSIWNNLSDDYKKALTSEGYSEAAMQKAINDAVKEQDAINEKPQYIKFELSQTGQTRDTGATAEMYNVTYRVAGRDLQTVFVVKFDTRDKVTEVIAQDPIVTAAFRKTKTDASIPQTGTDIVAPNFSAERFMYGLTTFDTQKIWVSLSPSYQKELSAKGITPQTMASELDKYKQQAVKDNIKLNYVGYTLVKGRNYPAGNSESSYVSTLQYGDQAGQFDYLVILDPNNKVQAITTTDPILNSMLGRAQQQGN